MFAISKSQTHTQCKTCSEISILLIKDLFSLLVIKLDGTTPVRYGLRLNMDEKYTGLKKQLSDLCGLKSEQILLAEIHGSNIKVILTSLSRKPLIPSFKEQFSQLIMMLTDQGRYSNETTTKQKNCQVFHPRNLKGIKE